MIDWWPFHFLTCVLVPFTLKKHLRTKESSRFLLIRFCDLRTAVAGDRNNNRDYRENMP